MDNAGYYIQPSLTTVGPAQSSVYPRYPPNPISDLPTANATNPTHARRDLLRDPIGGVMGEGDGTNDVS
jgi:hypothetical protein